MNLAGQCTPCREGTGWMFRMLEKMVYGKAEIQDIDKLFDVSKQVEGHTICAFGRCCCLANSRID